MQKPENYPQEPKYLWDQFFNFTQIPRPSKKEEKIAKYLIDLAKEHGLKYVQDKASNVIIYVPGKNGRENDAPIIIQNHIDMVTDATSDRDINFETDPIITFVKDGWLKADRTTLGADNGIGCAAALATIFDKEMVHPPLELLFTVDEETGLNGALGLETDYLKGRKMLNLDTEEWGSLYIGCAGGIDYEFNAEIEQVDSNKDYDFYELSLKGFVGGHSGVDIHEQRANAIKLFVELLYELPNDQFELASFQGGKAHNIIPREVKAVIGIDPSYKNALEERIESASSAWKSYLGPLDHNFSFELTEVASPKQVIDHELRDQLFNFLILFPHGAHAFDLPSGRELVSMSNNLAKVILINGKFYVQTSLRFFDRKEVIALEKKMIALAHTFGVEVERNSEYPSWKPVLENSVLEVVKEEYKKLFNKEAHVTAIHAGLECGILRDKIGPIEVVSFGPTIMGAHSPDERVNIETVAHFWNLFKAVLKKI